MINLLNRRGPRPAWVAFVAACAVAGAAGRAAADTIVLTSAKDNTLFADANGALSNGAGEHMFAGVTTRAGNVRRGVLSFDVAAALPAGATVTGATLGLFVSQENAGPQPLGVYRLSAGWGEGTSNAGTPGGAGAPATAGDATWVHRAFAGTAWATPGGDFAAAASDTRTVDLPGPYAWSGAGMVADVQAWLDSPAGNHGWLVKLSDESQVVGAKRFGTRENAAPDRRPTLTIDYTPVPEPAACGVVLAVACLTAARRRRRPSRTGL